MQKLEKILEEIKVVFEQNIVKELNGDGTVDKYSLDPWHIWHDIEEVIRKHIDDGWIPVEDGTPENGSEVLVVLESTYGTGYRFYSIARYLRFENYRESHWCDNHYGYLEWPKYSDGHGGSSEYRVIAWRPLPEPYRPKKDN